MKVLMINGGPHEKSCTYTALMEVAGQLEAQGIEVRLIQVGKKPVQDCIGCGGCKKTLRCVFDSDSVNECVELMRQADGLVVGSPVYFAGPTGAVSSFLNRMFYLKQELFAFKPAAAVVSCRRGGASAAFDRLNKYFTISRMPVVASQYWNAVHGNTPEEVGQDLEGMQIMRALGLNMAWMLKSIEAGGKEGLPLPLVEERVRTNFIR